MEELRRNLPKKQQQALLMIQSPIRGLTQVVKALGQTRKAPDQAWQQFRDHAATMLRRMAENGGGAAPARKELLEWLDAVHKMTDDEFAREAPGLPMVWAKILLPTVMKQLQKPEYQKNRMNGICRELVTRPEGYDLVEALIDRRKEMADKTDGAP